MYTSQRAHLIPHSVAWSTESRKRECRALSAHSLPCSGIPGASSCLLGAPQVQHINQTLPTAGQPESSAASATHKQNGSAHAALLVKHRSRNTQQDSMLARSASRTLR